MNIAFTALVLILVVAGALAWLVSGLAIALLLGRVIRNADRQAPEEGDRQ